MFSKRLPPNGVARQVGSGMVKRNYCQLMKVMGLLNIWSCVYMVAFSILSVQGICYQISYILGVH